VKIYDAAEKVFQIQESVWPRPSDGEDTDPEKSALAFTWTDSPFSFAIKRRATNETLFDTSAASLVFETQYLRLRTSLPPLPNLYGLGESTDAFHLNTTNYTRTVSLSPYTVMNTILICSALEPRCLWYATRIQSLWISSGLL
jgi:alpha-glucosidase